MRPHRNGFVAHVWVPTHQLRNAKLQKKLGDKLYPARPQNITRSQTGFTLSMGKLWPGAKIALLSVLVFKLLNLEKLH